MVNKQELLLLVQHAITILESKYFLCQQDVEIHTDLVALKEKLNEKSSKISWDAVLKVISKLIDIGDNFIDD